MRVKDPASDSSANYEEDDSMFTDREETTRHNKKEETSEESSDEDDEEIARSVKRPRRRWIAGLQVDSQDEDGLLEAILPRDKILPRRSERFLPVYQKPPTPWPDDLSVIQKKEATFFQRKMRAFRVMKVHLLTSSLVDLQEEALQKNWGEVPEFITKNRPKHYNTHIEVVYHHWKKPFE